MPAALREREKEKEREREKHRERERRSVCVRERARTLCEGRRAQERDRERERERKREGETEGGEGGGREREKERETERGAWASGSRRRQLVHAACVLLTNLLNKSSHHRLTPTLHAEELLRFRGSDFGFRKSCFGSECSGVGSRADQRSQSPCLCQSSTQRWGRRGRRPRLSRRPARSRWSNSWSN